MTALQRSLLTTIAYFDLFDYPLTPQELFHYLWQPPEQTTLHDVLTCLPTVSGLTQQNGLITFSNRTQLVKTRAARYLASEQKLKKRLRYIKLLTYLPWVQAIYIVNSLAYYNVQDHSDIDLLIIAKPGTIWSTRFFTTALAKLLKLRPQPNKTKDTLCLSFYLTNSKLNLDSLRNSINDKHEAYWLSQIFPIFDPHNITPKFFQANIWLNQVLPNHLIPVLHPRFTIKYSWLHAILQNCLGIFAWEQVLKKNQLAILPKKLQQLSEASTGLVILSDTLLKFHTYDPRPELEKQLEKNSYLSP
ncbi:MAG: hypothetical protein WCW27_04430 [Patescibacteria group bacterium]|jgi:hypothetical protein